MRRDRPNIFCFASTCCAEERCMRFLCLRKWCLTLWRVQTFIPSASSYLRTLPTSLDYLVSLCFFNIGGAAGYGLSHRDWAPPHSSRPQREASRWEADVELRTFSHHEAGRTVPPAAAHRPTKSNSGSSTTTQHHNHSSLRTSSHLPSSSNTHNTG